MMRYEAMREGGEGDFVQGLIGFSLSLSLKAQLLNFIEAILPPLDQSI